MGRGRRDGAGGLRSGRDGGPPDDQAGRGIFVGYDRPARPARRRPAADSGAAVVEPASGAAPRAPASAGGSVERAPEGLGELPLPRLRRRVGATLPLRLEPAGASGAGVVPLVFAVIWILFTLPPFVGVVVRGDFVSAAFLSLFVGIGGFLLWHTSKPFTRGWRKVPTVELQHEPIAPGTRARVVLHQPGPLLLERYRIELVCRERVSYRRGTTTFTDEHVLHEGELFCVEAHTVPKAEPWRVEVELAVPDHLPGSFASANNAIEWLLRVRAEIPRFPDLDERFPFLVLPAPGAAS